MIVRRSGAAHPRYRTRASTPIGDDGIAMDYFRTQLSRELEFDTDMLLAASRSFESPSSLTRTALSVEIQTPNSG
jgi:hypothetical protein